jgi:hypothetical protein
MFEVVKIIGELHIEEYDNYDNRVLLARKLSTHRVNVS